MLSVSIMDILTTENLSTFVTYEENWISQFSSFVPLVSMFKWASSSMETVVRITTICFPFNEKCFWSPTIYLRIE